DGADGVAGDRRTHPPARGGRDEGQARRRGAGRPRRAPRRTGGREGASRTPPQPPAPGDRPRRHRADSTALRRTPRLPVPPRRRPQARAEHAKRAAAEEVGEPRYLLYIESVTPQTLLVSCLLSPSPLPTFAPRVQTTWNLRSALDHIARDGIAAGSLRYWRN